jgi:hypothetical protein
VLHPSRQVAQHQQYLKDSHTAFARGEVALSSCAYLHSLRYDRRGEFDARHAELLEPHQLFAARSADDLGQHLRAAADGGDGVPVLTRGAEGKYQASKKLLDHTAAMIKGQNLFELLDEQLVVFNAVLGRVTKNMAEDVKSVILVRGGSARGRS